MSQMILPVSLQSFRPTKNELIQGYSQMALTPDWFILCTALLLCSYDL